MTSSFAPFGRSGRVTHAEKLRKFKSFQEMAKSGVQKYCQKLKTNSVDHVLRNTVRVEVSRIFVTEQEEVDEPACL